MVANSQATVRVTVAIPSNQKWADRDWEVWLGVAPEEKEFLVVNYYICLLVSTRSEAKASSHTELIVGIIVVLLLGYGIYYFSRKVKAK